MVGMPPCPSVVPQMALRSKTVPAQCFKKSSKNGGPLPDQPQLIATDQYYLVIDPQVSII
jgi:hypothetical protein